MSDDARTHDDVAIAARALAHLRAEGALRTIDGAFADVLRRRFGADPLVALAGAFAMRAVDLGHSGFTLARTEDLLEALAVRAALPTHAAWDAALSASPLVADTIDHNADATAARPTLLSYEYGRVSLCRYARYEQALAKALLARRVDAATDRDIIGRRADDTLSTRFRQLFALDTTAPLDRQAFAAWHSLQRRFLLITGGPGTGKTTTVARLLAWQLIAADLQGAPPLRIALAAPTGRAAVRLAEAIGERVAQDLDAGRIDAALAARIPRSAQTLHRLLGPRPGRTGFRHHAAHPLPFDLVIVDEASMIDLPLMAKLVDAVAPQARLVLLGDPDQLPAVEAGDVLGGLCEAAGETLRLDPHERDVATHAFGASLEALDHDIVRVEHEHRFAAPLAGHRVHLLHGWRQAGAQSLQALTETVRRGDDDTAMARLSDGDPALQWRHGDPAALGDCLRECVLPTFAALRDADDPASALQIARRMRVLTALRRGPFGAEFWNLWCAAELGARETQFHGRLIAITENNARHGLYNGDLGVLWRDRHDDGSDGGLVAWFEVDGRLRAWRPGQLPAHATAFATTVHKAQGSEFDTIALLLPDADTRALNRELLYTALTRARQRILLWAAPATLRRSLQRRSLRDSGLVSRLDALTSASV